MNSSWAASLALYAWLPLVLLTFAVLPAPRAVLVTYIGGWLFLPVTEIELFGFFDYSKDTAVPLAVLLGVLLFDSRRLMRFQVRAIDLPMAALCLAPLAASLSNGLGWYDGLSSSAYQAIHWGLPYLAGRLYFSSPEGLRRLALGLLAGGLLYVPLCLWELRMSPQLHATVYGFHQHSFMQTLRGGGYRPMVFMHHGLMLGLWMSAASLAGLALWWSGAVRRLWGLPLRLVVPVVVGTTFLCHSFGAVVLLLTGTLTLLALRATRSSLPVAVLVCLPLVYVGARVAADWSGSSLVEMVRGVNPDRASSLGFRLEAEEVLRGHALRSPVFGWGGWERSQVRLFADPLRRENITRDSLWIIAFGKWGFVGLLSAFLVLLVPIAALWRRCPPVRWNAPIAAAPWALAIVVGLYAVDNLFNAMLNPVYLLAAGGLCGLPRRRLLARPAPRAQARVAWAAR